MPKYVTMVQGPVVGVVQGDGASVYIGTNQVIVTQNGVRVYPKPYSEAKCRAWDVLQKAEALLLNSPLFETNLEKWLEARERVNKAWEQYHAME